MLTFSEVALNTEIAVVIQIVFFGLIFGAINGIYHRVCKWRGDPRGPKGKTVARGLLSCWSFLCSGRHMAGQRD